MTTGTNRMGRFLYGALFLAGVPAAMVWWAAATSDVVRLPVIHFPATGWATAALGLALMVSGMAALRVHGHGLPMNAYPPPVYVRRGIYRFVANPIYFGFGMLALGVPVAVARPAGCGSCFPLWLWRWQHS